MKSMQKSLEGYLSLLNDKISRVFGGNSRFESTVIAKNVRSFFEINYPFESKHDRTQHLSSMTRKMTVVSKAAEGIQSHLSKRASSSCRRESHQSFEERIINHLEATGNSSFRRESYRHFEKRINHHLEERVNPSYRKESQSSFRNEGPSIISKRQCGIISKR